MDRDTNVWESLGLDAKPEQVRRDEEPAFGVRLPDDTCDSDIFYTFGFGPTPEKPQSVAAPIAPKQVRRMRSLEAGEIEGRYWRMREREQRAAAASGRGLIDLWMAEDRLKRWREASDQQLFFDEPLHPTNDPYERDLHSTPYR